VRVYVLTYCRDLEQLYGSTLFFETVRDGFPTAELVVVDNASLPEAREAIRTRCVQVGAQFLQLDQEVKHHAFLGQMIGAQPDGPAIFLDPDVALWKNVEGWKVDGLMGGRLIPDFHDPYTASLTHRRLHTSFLWVPDVAALRTAVRDLRLVHFDFPAFAPLQLVLEGQWHRWDTGASLFGALEEKMQPWTEAQLDSYDHLFCGSNLPEVAAQMPSEVAAWFRGLHSSVRDDVKKLRGAWRVQEEFFLERAA
jgi:hypothetical protein